MKTMLPNNFVTADSSKLKEIHTATLKIRGRTLIFENYIYQISNISAIEVKDLTEKKEFPSLSVIMISIGAMITLIGTGMNKGIIALFGLLIIGFAGFMIYEYMKTSDKFKSAFGNYIVIILPFRSYLRY